MTPQQRKYLELAVKVGLNLQPGQPLVVGYDRRPVFPEHIEYARELTDIGYKAGASFVQVDWGDELWLRETIKNGSLELLEEKYRWQVQWVERLAREGAAYLAIPASDPDLYAGVDPARVSKASHALSQAFRPFTQRRTNNEYAWTLMSLPTQAWANKVYPELPESERVEAMWNDILYCTRATGEDPVADWHRHIENLSRRSTFLDGLGIRRLHYKSPDTDLWIGFPENNFWTTALSETPAGVPFVANMPTEEVYTVPLKTGVDGVVTSTMPLNHNGSLIEGIRLRFEGGRIVEYSASAGQDALASIIEADEGSHYLGEVALVPVDSPISQHGRLFYNTLFDENASCHLAIGMAYPLVHGGSTLPRNEWEHHGINDSLVHVDFMIGSDKLDLDAETKSGEIVPLMRGGVWTQRV